MSTLDEIVKYCQEIKPVGALLVTGEWGCGKTYLIDHELKDAIKKEACILRISLFGKLSVESIQKEVKTEWYKLKLELSGHEKSAKVFSKAQETVSKITIIPEEWRSFIGGDMTDILSIKNEIEYKEKEDIKIKKVILVFDDLERCGMNYVDVLGCINDYCENQGFHTIIIANQDKMRQKLNMERYDIDVISDGTKNKELSAMNSSIQVKKIVNGDNEKITYNEIKEKIVQRTVCYVPDLRKVVNAVIQNLPSYEDNYNSFIASCENGLIALLETEKIYQCQSKNQKEEKDIIKRPQNIRSLKCAISDFHRIYALLLENGMEHIDNWLYSFASYLIAFKANITKSGKYGDLFTDDEVRTIFPLYRKEYMFDSIKKWILYGVWDEELLQYEIEYEKTKNLAEQPKDIVRTTYILDIEEEIILEGFPAVLEEAYTGALTLDEYVIFLSNSCYAREYDFEYPISIEWDKVKEGIKKAINKLLLSEAEGQQVHKIIGPEHKSKFTSEELSAYILIEEFRNSDMLLNYKNKKWYICEIGQDPMLVFQQYQSKVIYSFDQEMAIATYNAYESAGNCVKSYFSGSLERLVNNSLTQYDMNYTETYEGLITLNELLEQYLNRLVEQNKKIAIRFTNNFISSINMIINRIAEYNL